MPQAFYFNKFKPFLFAHSVMMEMLCYSLTRPKSEAAHQSVINQIICIKKSLYLWLEFE